ncbi:MAG: TrbG/VirB9 family P-type conjugative transfer protein [Desulfovibrionaceae bacterium]|nr:TrbG/VirB9 family P-type conjugative transfer protein [Desulfovibrionaceae bacterium]
MLKRALVILSLLAILAFLIWFYLVSDFNAERDVHLIKAQPNAQYVIYCQTNKHTFIYLPKDEHIQTFLVLDGQKWTIDKLDPNKHDVLGSMLPFVGSKTSMIDILPKEKGGSARFMIKTNKNSYYLKCFIDPEKYKKKVRFVY